MRLHPILQILLAPLSLLYGIGVLLNDLLYRLDILRPTRFGVPTICVGNLTMGGSGKSPHVEYIVDFLRAYISVGTLSRGYKRKTRGFQLAHEASTPEDIGDEPLAYRRKFADVMVAVGENRTFAIMYMVQHQPDLQCIVLDDAFQHRAVQAGLSLLLTEYNLPFTRDYLLPSGRLREWRTGYQRANIIVVTKCPTQLTDNERLKLTQELNPYPQQRVYFSYYKYGAPYRLMFPSFTRSEERRVGKEC